MKDILDLLQSSEKQLTEIEEKVKAIDLATLNEELQKKRDSFFEKNEATRKAILAKKIEFFKILFSLRSLIPMWDQLNCFGPYLQANQFRYMYLKHNVGYLTTYKGESSSKCPLPDRFVTEEEAIFYRVCEDIITRIEECASKTLKGHENERALLINLREKLADLTILSA